VELVEFKRLLKTHLFSVAEARCGLSGCKNRPTPLPGWLLLKATKPGSIYRFLSIVFFGVLLFIRATFCVLLFFGGMCCLLVVLVKLSVLAN